ncbi:blue-light-activated histidine kinase [Allopontixanthobacter sediminis]|uniref:histidine kinase n=1 Tax=Allopontixanthobacter sediminis TaxID=1689985 RepID=A0A845B4J1_9SPHN|nr:PAS domain-containing protein [Allopontixanthobacter sediminis]MXP45318.1 PAS domain-containing protein [Allopontixanthobacter sediminis]
MKSFKGDSPAAALASVLSDRSELALVAVERTRMPMVVTDPLQPDSPIVLANEAFLKLTGYSANEVIGSNCRFLQGPNTAPEAIEEIRRGIAADDHFVTVELLNYRKDGSTFWNQLEISPVHDQTGQTIYHFASQKDVTERRRGEELEVIERLLLMEVDHRSMNALALVQSILQLTQANDISGYSAAVMQRVDAIARVHRLLAKSSWSGTLLTDLITEEMHDERVQLNGPRALISPRLAQPLAVVLHELTSNARQHGALLTKKGRISVSWTVAAEELQIEWWEQGTHPIVPEPQIGFGLSLVQAAVNRQLQGTTKLNWGNDSFRARMVIPTDGDVRIVAS